MRTTLSAAVTQDGYLDDNTPKRLMISTPEDWVEVNRLRTLHDAILVGAETLRKDNPSLVLRDAEARERRVRLGLRPDIIKVTLTNSGDIPSDARFFTEGDCEKIVFSRRPLPALEGLATVVVCEEEISACFMVTELEKRGIGHLFVEGGAQVLDLFLREKMADELRLAVNPNLVLTEQLGGARFLFHPQAETSFTCQLLGDMQVSTWQLHRDTSEGDEEYLRMAIEESRKCTPCATSYCVGAVIVTARGELFKGYTHETSATHHAEQEAIKKALAAGAELRGASIYSSMEPCSKRASEPESCTELILKYGFSHVAFALYEPSCFVTCHGALTLRQAGVDVRACPGLGNEVLAVNAHLGV